jgi:hypothetical protein
MYFKLFTFIVLVISGISCDEETEDKTITLNDENFARTIAENNHHFFVMFFAPW